MSYEKQPPTYPPAFNATPGGYPSPAGYASPTGYASPGGYAGPAGYAPPVGYAAQPYMIQQDACHIRDYLAWSIVNLLFGWGFGGILPLIFSIMCRTSKANNNVSNARSMSTLALIFNIIVTIGGVFAWLMFIIFMSISVSY